MEDLDDCVIPCDKAFLHSTLGYYSTDSSMFVSFCFATFFCNFLPDSLRFSVGL